MDEKHQCKNRKIQIHNFYDKINNNNESDLNLSSIKFPDFEKEFETFYKNTSNETLTRPKAEESENIQHLKKINKMEHQQINNLQNFKQSKKGYKNKLKEVEGITKPFSVNTRNIQNENNLGRNKSIEQILMDIQDGPNLRNTNDHQQFISEKEYYLFNTSNKIYLNNVINSSDFNTIYEQNVQYRESESSNIIHIWYEDNKLTYTWNSTMKQEYIKKGIYDLCMNIINDDFYLVRIKRLIKENITNAKESENINGVYYKLFEEYYYKDFGNIRNCEEYLIKKINFNKSIKFKEMEAIEEVENLDMDNEKAYEDNFEELINPLNFPEVLRAIEYAKEGSNLLKHTFFNIPHLRYFILSKNLKYIRWFSSRKYEEDCKIYFKNINSLEINNMNDNIFSNYQINLLKNFTFCIIYNNQKKKITLTCKCLYEFNTWVTVIRSLMFKSKNLKTTKRILLSHIYQNKYENKTDGDTSHLLQTNIHSKSRSENDEENKLKTFHLFNLIKFPNYNIYQAKIKFLLLKEKFYKYKIWIEEEINEYNSSKENEIDKVNLTSFQNEKNNSKNLQINVNSRINMETYDCNIFEISENGSNVIEEKYDLSNPDLIIDAYSYMDEDSNEFKLRLMIKFYNQIDEKIKIIQKNILDVGRLLKRNESLYIHQNQQNGFNIEHIFKHAFELYKTVENKLFKNKLSNPNTKNYNNYDIKENTKVEKLGNGQNPFKIENIIPDYQYYKNIFNNSFLNINTNKTKIKTEIYNINAPDKCYEYEHLTNIDNYPYSDEQYQIRENMKTPNNLENPIEEINNIIQKIMFNLWMSEIKLANVEDIYNIYVYNLKTKNRKQSSHMADIDTQNIWKYISNLFSETILKSNCV
ncbi:conserved Plasmodium protein, unknown function [Plasmodium berghei]|uniref:PH domain-containing protein n=2 Tax=Plasmodium berghei TaxID=5821 RepID=A0A509AFZ1_PLABA|nr:conserved Plasmodium protein, unknown function [Plasmodium berghei ANKA]CXI07414.1 conserved Plasmodium protein, unknown function [Plasmodium berghei]SCL92599.1 conserved Plasmodium protein, unknown function [Plasmodium berghei]SCM15674.1 conserved Plasmodium protein, unknown function [Plasmodium berghei]SCM17468.1 conserved Plasmodium protein, unknown function [Plasmodium berghei]SCN22827.1 conserved Plasmodium protein, unknown function [Plasmodium berghei]|eukprot:XP_034420279.1 conserved Plasmodium protein, unknown function [Plasmodium berghei ANKA]